MQLNCANRSRAGRRENELVPENIKPQFDSLKAFDLVQRHPEKEEQHES